MVQRKSACACGGGCPGCEKESDDLKVQTKLAISTPGDPFEQEADRVAEHVMSMPDTLRVRAYACGSERDRRRPEQPASDHQPLRAKRVGAGNVKPMEVPPRVHDVLRSPGQPLDSATLSFFVPRFRWDFSRVRIHDDAVADDAARALRARAYTQGHDIVFASGQFAPGTREGRTLIAHELAHVAQHRFASPEPAIFRAANDFKIRGKFGEALSFSELIFFYEDSSALDVDEKAKVAALALPASDMVTLNGFASEEGSDASNLAIVRVRLDAVAAELVADGHDAAKITKVPLPSSGKGRIDYRRLRSVEVLRPGASSAVPSAAAAATAACAGSNETDFKDAEAEAEAMIDKAVTALGTVPIPAAMTALLTRFFSAWAAADAASIKTNLGDIKTQLHRLLPAANHECAIIKYAACEAGSEAQNTLAGSTAMMTMCPIFFVAGKSKKARGGTLLHEASHGTPGLVTDDKAYAHERLIEFLGISDALKNSDTYTLLVRLFDTAGSMTVGPSVPDPLTGGMTPTEKANSRRTMAWMEKWLIWSYQEMSSLYDTILASIAAGAWTNTYYRDTMSLVASLFGLTVPPALPTKTDQVKVAAIHDRFHIMRATEWSKAVTLNKVAAGVDTWAPGPGPSVDLTPAFFADTPRRQLDRLLTAIATATPDVSLPFVAKYVALADKIRMHMGGGSP